MTDNDNHLGLFGLLGFLAFLALLALIALKKNSTTQQTLSMEKVKELAASL